MKRLLVIACLVLAPSAFAQHAGEHGEAAAQESGQHKGGEHASLDGWKWANFLMLAGALGYLIVKKGGPFFQARGEQIRRDIVEAEKTRQEADQRTAEVERRLSHLDAEIESLRQSARSEAAAEGARVREATNAHIAKIQAQAEQEIAAAGKTARLELKRYAAQLSIALARQRIRERMDPETEDAMVQSFVSGLERARKAQRN